MVGTGQPCYVIAEIGSNHNQDFGLACEMILAAAEAGADAVKFQTFKASEHYSRRTPKFNYLKDLDPHDLIQSLELDRSWQVDLKKYAESQGVAFFSSPCDSEAIQGLATLDVPAYKVASFDLTDDRLVSEIAQQRKPVIISTGMATWMDIQLAVNACLKEGNKDIILLQCTSLYPAPASLANLAAMGSMRSAFGLHTGYSDHTEGDHFCLAAVAMGACVIEKHFTIDRKLPGPDHSFAMEPLEFKEMIDKIRQIEQGIGDGIKDGPREEEKEMAEKGRRSLHAAIAIAKGEVITPEMLVIKRPGLGVTPYLRNEVVGRKARVDIQADDWITWQML